MSAAALLVDEGLRQRIAMTRVVCILGMIYVHVPSAMPSYFNYALDLGDLWGSLQGFVIEGLGRASAALLSVVSGYLMAVVLTRPGVSITALIRRRFESIILPMIIWSAVTLFVYLLVSTRQSTFLTEAATGDVAGDLWQYLNYFLFLTELPMGPTMHLAVLRDLFICILISPLLLMAVRHAALPLLLVVGGVYFADLESPFILRPLILFAYVIGLTLAVKRWNMTALDALWPVFVLLSAVMSLAILSFNGGAFTHVRLLVAHVGLDVMETVLYPLSRLFGSLAIWTVLSQLVGSRFGRQIESLTPWLFAAYCSHYLVLSLVWEGFWLPLTGARTGLFYSLWFILAPGLAILIAWTIVEVSARIWPGLALILTGGRRRCATVSKPRMNDEAVAQAKAMAFMSVPAENSGEPLATNQSDKYRRSADVSP